jgi:hypothetical protein
VCGLRSWGLFVVPLEREAARSEGTATPLSYDASYTGLDRHFIAGAPAGAAVRRLGWGRSSPLVRPRRKLRRVKVSEPQPQLRIYAIYCVGYLLPATRQHPRESFLREHHHLGTS